jgi:CheY-like chemotaxis protein
MTATPSGLPLTSILVMDDMPENIDILARLLTAR